MYDSTAEPTTGHLLEWNATTKKAIDGPILDDAGTNGDTGKLWSADKIFDQLALQQTIDAELTAIAGLTSAADKGIQFTGVGTAAVFDLTAFAKTILDDADEATFKATVNLEIGTDVQAYDSDLDTWATVTSSANGQSLVSAADYAAMKVLLDLEIGTDVQAWDAHLDDLAAISPAQGNIIYFDGSDWVALAVGTDGYFLKTQGAAANPVWAAVSATPGGANTQVQYNDSGAFGGDAGMTYTTATDTLTLAGGIELGNNTGTTDGTIRWTGTDLEVYNSGWTSLTAGAAGGEANTMSSQGSGVSIYYQKSALDLQLNAIKSENDRLTCSLDTGTHDIELTVNEGNIILDNCDNTASGFKDTRTGVYRTLWIDAGACVSRTTNGMAAATEEYATNDVMSDHFLADATTSEAVQFRIVMPDVWDHSTIKFKIFWDAATGASAADQVSFGVRAAAVSNDDPIDGSWGTAVVVDDVVIAVGDMHVSPASAALTVGGTPALADVVWFEVYRNVGGNDNMTEDAKFLGIQVLYAESSTEISTW